MGQATATDHHHRLFKTREPYFLNLVQWPLAAAASVDKYYHFAAKHRHVKYIGGGGLDLPKSNAAIVLADKGIEIYT